MRDISTITGQALPSSKRLLLSTLSALVVATLVLVLGVLPAEYGVDLTGLGQRMGLAALHQSNDKESNLINEVSSAPINTLLKKTEKWRSDDINLTLPAKQGLEIKAHMKEGETLLFQWEARGGTVSFDMHGNVINAAEDDFTSFWLGKGETQAAGIFTAPFSGLHGWYWENETNQVVRISLTTEGYYQELVSH